MYLRCVGIKDATRPPRGVNVGGPSLESNVGVRDSTSRVVVEVRLDVAAHDFAQGVDLLENFPRRGTAQRRNSF